MPKWIDANGGFFETFKKVAFNEGASARATKRAATKQSEKASKRVSNNLKDGETLEPVLENIKKDAREVATKYNIDEDSMEQLETASRNLHADGKSIKNLSEKEIDELGETAAKKLQRGSAVEAVKGYWSDPYRNLKSADADTRSLAAAQLVGRTAAVGGAATLGVGITHDLFSKKENDTGFGGVVGNTLGVTALSGAGAGIAAGIGMVKKL